MRREEVFMDILGGLDEKYVSMAMPRSGGHVSVGDTGNIIEIEPVEVSRKDLRIYRITRVIGMAAALALVVGAAVLLMMNWDKIAVSEPDRPGVVTTVGTSSTVTATSLTEPTKSENNTADSDKINELRKRIGEKKREIENAESAKNAYVQKADDAGGRLTDLTEKLEELRALDETPETIQEISAAEAEIEYYSELKAAYDKEISNYEEHIDSLKRELSDLEHEELLEVEKMRDIQHSETTTYVNENKERPVTTSSENHEITTSETTVAPSDEASETTAPAEEQTSDDELKALVEQGADACGLKITVSDLTRASLKLHYTRDSSVKNANRLSYEISNRYTIQVLGADGKWTDHDPVARESWEDGTHWFDSLLGLGGEVHGDEENELVLFYGDNMYETEIPDGHYRIRKYMTVSSEITGESLGGLNAYAEFTIDERTPNIFGITMTANDASPESVKLVVRQSGANFHVKSKLGYEHPYYIQRRNSNGEWEEPESNPVTWDPDIEPLNENGTTEITVKFARNYGALPNGTYRISQTFVNYAYSGTGELSVINRSTYFCEFTITDGEKDWGITMTANDVTAEGLALVISQRGGSYTGELEYGEPYSVERRNGDKWEPVKYLLDDVAWADIGYTVEPDSDKEEKLDWKRLYGSLPAGTYRIAKEFMDFRRAGDYDDQTLYAEFVITEDMVSKLGISLSTAQYNARRMTLQIVQNGGVTEGDILYDPAYTVEREIGGKWKEPATLSGMPAVWNAMAQKLPRGKTTKIVLDWESIYGSLPVGRYRICKKFICGSVTEMRYCEFTVEESMTNALGISIEILEASKTGAKLDIKSKGADEQGYAYFDKELYTIEKKNSGGKWKNIVSTVSSEMFTGRITMAETGYAGMLETINWSGWCGELSPGNYRISFKFRTGEGDSYKEITLYAEFDSTADTPDKLTD